MARKAGTKAAPPVGANKATNRKTNANTNSNHEDVRRDTPLQAIVFADSFTETFRPITLTRPKVLLPLANVPMLEYSLEFLAAAGVEEVLLFCTHHVEEIEAFIQHDSQAAHRLPVRCVHSPTCVTAGDALREIDRQQLIQSDPFVLMSGDVVANVNLQQIIHEHTARKQNDPNCILTAVFKQVPPATGRSTGIRALADELVVGLDAATNQIVLYENDPAKRSTHLATVFVEEHARITLRADLLDCFIDVCSPEVLLKFAEDFDYQDLRQDFFHNEVQNYELGKKFFAHVVTDAFAARVMDPRTYAGISRAILQRWVFPMVPDNNYLGQGDANYTYERSMVYVADGVALARTCRVGRESIIGKGTRCGDKSVIRKSAIGRNCVLGTNVVIENSFLWGDVVVEDNARISNAILCDNVVVRAGATVEEGCVLSFGVVIGAGFTLKAYSKVTTADKVERDDGFASSSEEEEEEEEDEEEEEEEEGEEERGKGRSSSVFEGEWNPKHVGVGGVGRLWTLDDDGIEVDSDDDEEEEEDPENSENPENPEIPAPDPAVVKQARRLEKLKLTLMGAADAVAKQACKWDEWETLSSSMDGSDASDAGDLVGAESDDDKRLRFERIIREMVVSGDAAGNQPDDCFMEIKSYKFAQNRSFAEVLHGIIPGLLDRVATGGQSALQILGQVRARCQRWSSVVTRCLVEDGDQASIIEALEAYVLADGAEAAAWKPLFRFLLQTVYDLEWVSEEVVLEWHAERADAEDGESAPATQLAMSKGVLEFIEWLQDEEEDDDDDDDEEEEEESDDE